MLIRRWKPREPESSSSSTSEEEEEDSSSWAFAFFFFSSFGGGSSSSSSGDTFGNIHKFETGVPVSGERREHFPHLFRHVPIQRVQRRPPRTPPPPCSSPISSSSSDAFLEAFLRSLLLLANEAAVSELFLRATRRHAQLSLSTVWGEWEEQPLSLSLLHGLYVCASVLH